MQPLAPEDRAHTGNRLLDALPQPALKRLRPHLEPVPLPSRQVLSKPGEPIDHAHFVQQGMVSLVTPLSDGAVIEIGLIGAEGFVGGPSCWARLTDPACAISTPAMRVESEPSPP